jgi:hypothetical protein
MADVADSVLMLCAGRPTADLSDLPALQKTHMRDIAALAHATPGGKYLHVQGSEGGHMALSTTSNSDADAARCDGSATSSAAGSRPLMAAIGALNSASAKNPMTLFYLFFATRATTWGILCKAFSAAQLCEHSSHPHPSSPAHAHTKEE